MGADPVPLKMFRAKYAMYLKQIDQFNIDQKTRRGRIPTPPMHMQFCDYCTDCGKKITWQKNDGDMVPCLD